MQYKRGERAADSRLRLVFPDAVMSFSLAADATFEDVARRLRDMSIRRFGDPLAIDVIIASGADLATEEGRYF